MDRWTSPGHPNCNDESMFVKEFFFSFSLLVFTLGLLLFGLMILADALRRFVQEWLKAARDKNGRVVLLVDVARPVANSVGNGAHNLVQRPLAMTNKKVQ